MKKNRTNEEAQQPKKMTSIGGQALMEGLMMIGPKAMAMAVRLPNGQIHVETAPIGKSSQAAKIPFIRGSVKIFRQMITGTRYLLRSAQFIEDDIKQENTDNSLATIKSGNSADSLTINAPDSSVVDILDNQIGITTENSTDNKINDFIDNNDYLVDDNVKIFDDNPVDDNVNNFTAVSIDDDNVDILSSPIDGLVPDIEMDPLIPIEVSAKLNSKALKDKKKKEKEDKGSGRFEQFLMKNTEVLLYFSAIFGIFLSVGMFILLPNLLTNLTIGFWIDKNASIMNSVIYSLFEGVLRITIFIAYLAIVSNMKDIRRVWMYHGAEHKTISCYESGMPLTVANVRGFSKHHPRCGTAFMFIILIISIIIFSFVPKINIILDLLIRLACVPILASLAYEVIHWSARHDNILTKALSWPGLMLQRLTTKEPDDSMMEVAIAAMLPVIPAGERGDEW